MPVSSTGKLPLTSHYVSTSVKRTKPGFAPSTTVKSKRPKLNGVVSISPKVTARISTDKVAPQNVHATTSSSSTQLDRVQTQQQNITKIDKYQNNQIGFAANVKMDLDISDESSTDNVITPPNLQPNKKLQVKYRNYLKREGLMKFLNRYIPLKSSKRELYELLINLGYEFPLTEYETLTIKELVTNLADLILQDRDLNITLPNISLPSKPRYSVDRFLDDLVTCKRILVVTGAGISTSLGIPDFRSFKGLYSQLDHLNLKDPQHSFNIKTFNRNPEIFFSIAHLILPPEGKVSITHDFIRLLQQKNKLLKNYTQNIDNLEERAGILPENLVHCHGSFGTAKCITCKSKYAGPKIFPHIQSQTVPRCFSCYNEVKLNDEVPINYGIIKPDITFFGEDLPRLYYKSIKNDIAKCDMIIVIGTSLKVEPVASIVDRVSRKVPRILINRDLILDRDFNLTLLGDCDNVTSYISQRLGKDWRIPHSDYNPNAQFVCESDDPDENIYKIEPAHSQ